MARYLGIEITEGQVKALILRGAYRKMQVEAVARASRLPGPEGLSVVVRQLLAQLPGPVDAAYVALPGTEASLRVLELPKAVVRRGPRVIATELEGSLPFDVEQAVIDTQSIRPGGDPVELMAAAARIDRVRSLISAMKDGGVDPREVGVAPLVLGELASVVPELSVPGPVLVIYAYENNADIAILANGRLQTARTLSSQTTPEARARGILQTVSAYMAGGGTQPTVGYVCGDQAQLVHPFIAEASGIAEDSVQLGIPLGEIEVLPGVSPIEPQLAPLALALAIRGTGRSDRVDLRKGELTLAGGAQVLRERAWLLVGCLAAVLASWAFAVFTRYASISEERSRLKTALEQVTLDVFGEKVGDPQRARGLATGSGDTDQDPMPAADAFDVIGVLSARIPDAIRHDITQLDINDERIQMQGLVDTLQHRDEIIAALRGYDCFANVQPGRAQRNTGDSRQQYALEIDFRCPERQRASTRRRGTGGTTGGSTGGSTTGGNNASGS